MNQIKNCPTCGQSELSPLHIVDCAAAPLDPSAVKAGETVTLTRKMSTAVGPVTRIDRIDSKGIGFHIDGYPYPLWTQVHPRWTLTDHQPAPEPEPGYEPGKVYEHPNGDRLWSVNSERRVSEPGVQFVNEYGGPTGPLPMASNMEAALVMMLRGAVEHTVDILKRAECLPELHELVMITNGAHLYAARHTFIVGIADDELPGEGRFVVITTEEAADGSGLDGEPYQRFTNDLDDIRAWLTAWAVAIVHH